MRKYFFITFSLSLSLMMCSSVLAQSPHSYFDLLSAKPELLISHAYRTQAEIDADPHNGAGNTVYDPVEDAAKFTLPNGGDGTKDASIPSSDQVRPPFTPKGMTSGNLFIFYELKHESGFVSEGDVQGLERWKMTQVQKRNIGRRQAIEPRYHFIRVDPPYVADVDVRIYGDKNGYADNGLNSIGPQTGQFDVLPDVWTRHWLFVDIENKELSYWVGDETRANVTILDHVPMDYALEWPGGEFIAWWLEANSSSKRDAGAPALNFWGRNLVILEDVLNAESLVSQGDSGGGGGGDVSPPNPPQNLNVQ